MHRATTLPFISSARLLVRDISPKYFNIYGGSIARFVAAIPDKSRFQYLNEEFIGKVDQKWEKSK
jgi:hypothetical protein